MGGLLRLIGVECLKLRRTLALRMVLAAPLVLSLLSFLIAWFGAARLAQQGGDQWMRICQNTVGLWTLLMLPLYVTLQTSLLAGLEHAHGNWKGLLSLPVRRWAVYLSKLLVAISLLWAAHAVLVGLTLASGVALQQWQPVLGLAALDPWRIALPMLKVSGAALLGLTIQHWVSLRYSFTGALGFGMSATVLGFVAANSEWGRWIPWSLPIHAAGVMRRGVFEPLPLALGGAVIVAALGSLHFHRSKK
jgi:hypothetical protein